MVGQENVRLRRVDAHRHAPNGLPKPYAERLWREGKRVLNEGRGPAVLMHQDLSDADMQGFDFSESPVGGLFFMRADLRFANFQGSNFSDDGFSSAASMNLFGSTDFLDISRSDNGRSVSRGTTGGQRQLELYSVLNGSLIASANLRGASGLSCEILSQAIGWELAYRDPELACGAPIPDPLDDLRVAQRDLAAAGDTLKQLREEAERLAAIAPQAPGIGHNQPPAEAELAPVVDRMAALEAEVGKLARKRRATKTGARRAQSKAAQLAKTLKEWQAVGKAARGLTGELTIWVNALIGLVATISTLVGTIGHLIGFL